MDYRSSNSAHEDSSAAMSPATTKRCTRCGEGFRGTMAPEEVYCAKCYVKTCDVPEDTDEQFLKLVSETYGPEMAKINPQNTALLLPMMKDIMSHKARLKQLEKNVEENRYKSTKEKNRMKREIFRLREEIKERDILIESIKSKMLHLALVQPSKPKTGNKGSSTTTPGKTAPSPASTSEHSFSTPIQSPLQEVKVEKENTPTPPLVSNASSGTPIRSPTETEFHTPEQNDEQPPSSPKRSPVKMAAAKFEEAAKRVNTAVTFAKLPSKKYAAPQPPPTTTPKKEVNNNDTPVTASSSSEDEGESETPKTSSLARSNSVRDRIRAFEEIQRSASTGSYDRRTRRQEGRTIGKRSLTMKSVNI